MKFIFADSQDYVDPRYDFLNDLTWEGRQPYWDDQYPHEILGYAPYDGVLISRAVVGSPGLTGRYSEAQAMRLRRVGAREFLRFNKPEHLDNPVFGDCGAFSYAKQETPPYSAADTVEFYADGQFTHGCSVDHIIFEFDSNAKGLKSGSGESRTRFNITLQLATEFIAESRQLGERFTPVGVIQGWSPDSLATAAIQLIKMGYRYLAIGGLVPLKVNEIHEAVGAVHNAISRWPAVKLHLLGFAKADHLHEFTKYKQIASFDTTSPLLRAFKDSKQNYYLPSPDGKLEYFTAIRIPQALDNIKLKHHASSGRYVQEDLLKMERRALHALRAYDSGDASIEETLDAIVAYSRPLHWTPSVSEESLKRKLHTLRLQYRRTLEAKPWQRCPCTICRTAAVETIIFRASNRNKRRGIHNLGVFYEHLKRIHVV